MNALIDLEKDLYLAAARAQEVPNSIKEKELNALKARHTLETGIREQVDSALDGTVPMEDAILRLNVISGKETELPESIFDDPMLAYPDFYLSYYGQLAL